MNTKDEELRVIAAIIFSNDPLWESKIDHRYSINHGTVTPKKAFELAEEFVKYADEFFQAKLK